MSFGEITMMLNKYCYSIESRRETVLRHPVLTVFLALALVTTMINVRADRPVKSSGNPVLKYMSELHPMSEKYARRSGDLNGDSIPESVRADLKGTLLVIEDAQGNFIGSIKFREPVQGFSIADVNDDGRAEILVLTDGLQRLRAYDQYGNQLAALNQQASRLAQNYYELALKRSLEYLYAHPRDDGKFVPPVSSVNDIAFDCNGASIEWDGVSEDRYGRHLIEGTNGDDLIRGTNGNDLIIGYGGSDTICGRGGDDVIYGDDMLFNSVVGDSDTIHGGSGNDLLYGGAGIDTMFAGYGDDSLFGGDEFDLLFGDDNVYPWQPGYEPGDGDDFLVGMLGIDSVVGGAGNDVVNATAHSNHQSGALFFMDYGEVIGDFDTCYVYIEHFMDTEGCESVKIDDWHSPE